MWYKWRFLEINIHFIIFTDQPLFASKQTFARIDFLRQGGCLVGKKGTHNVKFLAEKLTEYGKLTSEQEDKWTSERVDSSFLVSLKVCFLAMTMLEQVRQRSIDLLQTFFSRVLA